MAQLLDLNREDSVPGEDVTPDHFIVSSKR